MNFRPSTPDWIRSCPRPWVVIDWGVLRGMSKGDGLPGQFTVIMPDRVLPEVLGTSAPDQFLRKLNQILQHPSSYGRVLIGRYWNDIADDELTPAHVQAGSLASIHLGYSEEIRKLQHRKADVFLMPPSKGDSKVGDENKSEFLRLLRSYAQWIETAHPNTISDLRKGGLSAMKVRLGQASESIANFTGQESKRYRSSAWRKTLLKFPDNCAVGRWMRVMTWYALKHLVAPDKGNKKLGNDYDDAHYAFLGLYTRHTWTGDSGLAETILAVSAGKARVHETWNTIPRRNW